MKDRTENEKRDYHKFFVEDGDAGFVARRNKQLVNEVIKETLINRKNKSKLFEDRLRERSDAVATYLKAIQRGKRNNVDKYFGRRELARLRGEKIIETIKGEMRKLSAIN